MLGALRTDTASADAGLPAAASALVTARSSIAMIQIVVKVVGRERALERTISWMMVSGRGWMTFDMRMGAFDL